MTAQVQRDLEDYFLRCQRADWFYMMADDGNAYRRGKEGLKATKADADTKEKREILAAFETTARSHMTNKSESEWLDWPEAKDFNIGPADLDL